MEDNRTRKMKSQRLKFVKFIHAYGFKMCLLYIIFSKDTSDWGWKICQQELTTCNCKTGFFHFVDWTRTVVKCTTMKNARAKCAKLLVFLLLIMQISCKFSPSSGISRTVFLPGLSPLKRSQGRSRFWQINREL